MDNSFCRDQQQLCSAISQLRALGAETNTCLLQNYLHWILLHSKLNQR